MTTDTRYDDYFEASLGEAAGGEDKAAAARNLLEHIEKSLATGDHPQEVVAQEMALARAAAQRYVAPSRPDEAPELSADPDPAPPAKAEPAPVAAARSRARTGSFSPRWLLAAAALVYLVSLGLFVRESFVSGAKMEAQGHDVGMELSIAVADFSKETVTFHVLPTAGPLLQNGMLTKDVEIEIDPGDGPKKHVFRANSLLTPWTLPVFADSGDILDYPFDKYMIELEVAAKSEGKQITVQTELDKVPHGLSARLLQSDEKNGDAADTILIRRAGTIVFLAFLSMFSLLLVSSAACTVAWQVAVRGRKLEFSMLIWTAALLFVVPAVRNGLPGAPPPGAFVDFALFFWVQIAIAVAMASLVFTWWRRPPA